MAKQCCLLLYLCAACRWVPAGQSSAFASLATASCCLLQALSASVKLLVSLISCCSQLSLDFSFWKCHVYSVLVFPSCAFRHEFHWALCVWTLLVCHSLWRSNCLSVSALSLSVLLHFFLSDLSTLWSSPLIPNSSSLLFFCSLQRSQIVSMFLFSLCQ